MEIVPKTVELLEAKSVFNIGSKIASKREEPVELAEIIRNKTLADVPDQKFEKASFSFRLANQHNHKNTCALIRSITFDAQLSDDNFNDAIEVVNFTDATECVIRSINEPKSSIKNRAYWISTGVKNVHMSKIVYCTFTYDSYEAAYGNMKYISFPITKLEEYAKKGWITWKVDSEDDPYTYKYHITSSSSWAVKDKEKSPVVEFFNVKCDEDNGDIYADVLLTYYKFYGFPIN